jgi:carbonic anhydrase
MAAVRTIIERDRAELDHVRQFFRNYAAWLGVDLRFQNFAEEMATLPSPYSAPRGRLFYAEQNGRPAGCVGIRPFAEGVCEMKRLYVHPELRGQNIGRALALAGIHAARELGYRRMLVDTLPAMRIALRLYRELGFTEVPAYYPTPVDGTVFLALDLENWSPDEIRNQRLLHLLDYNRAWAKRMCELDHEFFSKLSREQEPEYLWIGCSDSRVPANQIVGLLPGDVFVHRNVANVVVHTDLNCLSVIQFGVEILHIKHIMVVGHYGCGGVRAALLNRKVGLTNNWLRHVQDVRDKHDALLNAVATADERENRLCELNVLEQVANVCHTSVVQEAWSSGQELIVHGWIYSLRDGLLRDLDFTVTCQADVQQRYRSSLAALRGDQLSTFESGEKVI